MFYDVGWGGGWAGGIWGGGEYFSTTLKWHNVFQEAIRRLVFSYYVNLL